MLAGGTALAQVTVIFAGQVIPGGVISLTVINWAHVAVLPQISVAVYTLVIKYLLVQVWLVMTSAATVTATTPEQLSVVVTNATFAAGTALAQDTVTFAGQVKAGGVTSFTVIN
jgi:hypothetical protein